MTILQEWGIEMNYAEYQEKAKRTLLDAPITPFTAKESMVLWCMLGLYGEVNELECASDKPVRVKELGDCYWYVSSLVTLFDLSLFVLSPRDNDDSSVVIEDKDWVFELSALRWTVRALGEYLKKGICHQHGIRLTKISGFLINILFSLETCVSLLDVSRESVLALNLEKLEERFPDAFNTADSMARRDIQAT